MEWKESREKCNTIAKPGDYPEKIPKECPFENCTVWARGGRSGRGVGSGGVGGEGSERSALPQKHKQLGGLLIVGQNCIPITNEEMEQRLTQPWWPDGGWWSTYWTSLYCESEGKPTRLQQATVNPRQENTRLLRVYQSQNQAEVQLRGRTS